jgi:hypothetical protein
MASALGFRERGSRRMMYAFTLAQASIIPTCVFMTPDWVCPAGRQLRSERC